MIKVAVTIIVLLGGLSVFMTPALAYTDADDITECERRNLTYACSCDCTDPIVTSVCIETDTQCRYSLSSSGTGNVRPFFGVDLFPSIGSSGGILVLGVDGNILVGKTAANVFKWVFWFIAGIAVFYGIYGAFTYSTAGASEEKVEKAQGILRNALIGFLIAVAGLMIVVFISNVFGFSEGARTIDDVIENDKTNIENDLDRQEQKDFFDNLFR